MADTRTTTLYVVAYDITSDKRRNKVFKTLSGFGKWSQYSLFECHLNERQYLQLRARLERNLEESQDSVRFYPLCASCQEKVETVGSPPPNDPEMYLV
jgi:CRISPR-associated protein Cas2